MTLIWIKEASPRWDADKQRLFGPAELAAVGLAPGAFARSGGRHATLSRSRPGRGHHGPFG